MQRAIIILAAAGFACVPGGSSEQYESGGFEPDATTGTTTTSSTVSDGSLTDTADPTTLSDPSDSSTSTSVATSDSQEDASETTGTASSDADASGTVGTGSSSSGGSLDVCGDGIESGDEECDDGDLDDFDGCSAACNTESEVMHISAGAHHTCAVFATGDVKCWGGNSNGQLGLEHTDDIGDNAGEMRGSLARTDLGLDAVFMAHASFFNQCATSAEGALKCWGRNAQGALGLGDSENRGDDPLEMNAALPFVDLNDEVSTLWNGCAQSEEGFVRCWGGNGAGVLGVGDTENRGDSPGEMGAALPLLQLGMSTIVQIATGGGHRCALDEIGRVKCWGDNSSGQLGLGDVNDRGDLPAEMGDALPFVDLGNELLATRIAAGASATCALLDTGDVKCWGANDYHLMPWAVEGDFYGDHFGEMGDALPAFAIEDGLNPIDIQMGLHFACVLFDEGSVKCWGSNSSGTLGQENDTPFQGPVTDLPLIDLGTGAAVTQFTVGWAGHVCALLDSGRVKCWGDNSAGALGVEDSMDRGDEPGEMGDALAPVGFF